jgi:hypothetical protein
MHLAHALHGCPLHAVGSNKEMYHLILLVLLCTG